MIWVIATTVSNDIGTGDPMNNVWQLWMLFTIQVVHVLFLAGCQPFNERFENLVQITVQASQGGRGAQVLSLAIKSSLQEFARRCPGQPPETVSEMQCKSLSLAQWPR